MRRGFVLLLVEDDPVLGPVTEALEIFGHAATVAACIDSAFRELRDSEFDAVILDLELGSEQGESLIDRIREARIRMPEIVILSALPMDVLLKAQRALNACGVLQKPISPADLAHELERCIPFKAGA